MWAILLASSRGYAHFTRPRLIVLCELCDALGWLTIDVERETIRANVALDRSRILTGAERSAAALLRDHAPVTISRAAELAPTYKIHPVTLEMLLRYSPIVRTSGTGTFALYGSAGAKSRDA